MSNDCSKTIALVVEALAMNPCKDGQAIAVSDSWVLLNQLPTIGWNSSEQMPPAIVDRQTWNTGILQKKSTFIASSRLPKNLRGHSAWFDALRTIGTRLDPDTHALVTVAGTTADQYVRRIGKLFGIDLIEVRFCPPEKLRALAIAPNHTCNTVFLVQSEPHSIDADLIKAAHTVHALSVRHGGNVYRGMVQRLNWETATAITPTRLLHNNALTKTKTRTALLESGAIDWLLLPDERTENGDRVQLARRPARLLPLDSIDQSQYLIHWARQQSAQWPDQDPDAHLDRLIFGSTEDRYHEMMTLCRIIASNRLIAAANLTRASAPVVCFSAVPVGELPQHTVFRKHLARWDFVPYGLAIRKSTLLSAGIKAVTYGDQSTWEAMSPEDRPWFQMKTTANGKIDWSTEKEWRLRGDLDLNTIGIDDAFAFVKHTADAERLAEICRWPIVVLEDVVDDS